MVTYQYQLIRYIPDHYSAEFVNVRLVVYVPICCFLQCKVITDNIRVSNFFNGIDTSILIPNLKRLKSEIESTVLGESSKIEVITSQIMNDAHSLQWSTPRTSLTHRENLQIVVNELYSRLVDHYSGSCGCDIQ